MLGKSHQISLRIITNFLNGPEELKREREEERRSKRKRERKREVKLKGRESEMDQIIQN